MGNQLTTMHRLFLIILVAFSIIIPAAGLILYFAHFNDSWSTENADWGTFGDFFNVFVNIASLLLVLLIAILTIRSSDRIADLQVELSQSQLKIEQLKVVPHIYISEKRSVVIPQDSWYIQHTGEGPAINILVRFNQAKNSPFSKWISCLSLGSGDERELAWLRHADTIQICYCDITEQICSLYTFQDRIGRTTSISTEDYLNFLALAIANNFNTHPDLVTRYLAAGHLNYPPFYASLL